jgi:hypothetical protein
MVSFLILFLVNSVEEIDLHQNHNLYEKFYIFCVITTRFDVMGHKY